ncbi:glycosyltransferase [bacterium]|nr:glycosyltransferase [bacterium]
MHSKRILVAWFRFSLNGSIGRFIHFARQVAPWGHEVDFLSLSGETTTDWPDFPGKVLTPDDVGGRSWDAVMVPGSGNPSDPIDLLATLRAPQYGLRVQHVLNDPSKRDRFQLVNRMLSPDIVVFNNGHWRPEDYRTFSADAFHTVVGAVDTNLFYPPPLKGLPCDGPRWRIGAFAKKNLLPVLDALELLPHDHVLHTFGTVPTELRCRVDAFIEEDRLVDHGSLFGDRLARFFGELDVMVTTETRGGWCNAAAEAMASGVPCVVSRAGTVDFAKPYETALVLDRVDGDSVAAAVRSLTDEPEAMRSLARAGARTMRSFGWNGYSRRLLDVIDHRPHASYYRIPELGLWGKWEPQTRLTGLHGLLKHSPGATVLDLGAAEGIISREFANRGASLVHGFELSPDRVLTADQLLRNSVVPEHAVRQADLSDWSTFEHDHRDLLREQYDVVLFLGLYHHLPHGRREESLRQALARCRKHFALRTPPDVSRDEDLVGVCERAGFRLVSESGGDAGGNLGWLGIFRRLETEQDDTAEAHEDAGLLMGADA